ncbi:MAG: hypothetical protein FWC70_03300 [Defluviitaleaceae bacterium]|nr:hypothetical protein [Defluviitaleaceae bacterium]
MISPLHPQQETARSAVSRKSFDGGSGETFSKVSPEIDYKKLKVVAKKFTGEILQTPPMYSAIKVGGKKLYELARKGQTIERAPRRVVIHDLNVRREGEKIFLDVRCSKGTYIRSLCADIGREMGCGAVMGDLVRTQSGQFSLDDAVTIDEIRAAAENGTAETLILPPNQLLRFPAATVLPEGLLRARNGNPLPAELVRGGAGEKIWLHEPAGGLLGLFCRKGENFRAEVMMATPVADSRVIAVGKFEGIHRGHRELIAHVVRRAKAAGGAAMIAVFEPHPCKYLRDAAYKPLFSPRERDEMIRALGVDAIVTLDFNEICRLSAREFCEKFFGEMQEVVAGENFRFGRGREGTIETLREAGTVFVAPPENFEGEIISTSRIRELLEAGDFCGAEKLLGFPFFIAGEVTEGRQLGRTLGFPTLNIYPPDDKFLPQYGVYATRTIITNAAENRECEAFASITNVGVRPTVREVREPEIPASLPKLRKKMPAPGHFLRSKECEAEDFNLSAAGEPCVSVETHVPDISFPGEMYGRQIKVEFLRFIRPEKKFASPEELRKQVMQDISTLS